MRDDGGGVRTVKARGALARTLRALLERTILRPEIAGSARVRERILNWLIVKEFVDIVAERAVITELALRAVRTG